MAGLIFELMRYLSCRDYRIVCEKPETIGGLNGLFAGKSLGVRGIIFGKSEKILVSGRT
jgi:hypothetical protein